MDDRNPSVIPPDESEAKSRVSGVVVRALLENVLHFLKLLAFLSNCIIIALQTDRVIAMEYNASFAICDDIVLAFFIWEILVQWWDNFRMFWVSGWNILDFVLTVALVAGPMLFPDGGVTLLKTMRVLRVIRCTRGILSILGNAEILKVIMQSIKEMLSILFALLVLMTMFAFLGMKMFNSVAPSAFKDFLSSLYTLFFCLTQEGWITAYKEFNNTNDWMKYIMASCYFVIFITGVVLLFNNLLFGVLLTNLEKSESSPSESSPSEEEGVVSNESLIKELLAATRPESLNANSLQEFTVIHAAIKQNMEEYNRSARELRSIVAEMRTATFSQEQDQDQDQESEQEQDQDQEQESEQEQDQEVIRRGQHAGRILQHMRENAVEPGPVGNMLSTLGTMEKAHVIESLSANPMLIHRRLKTRAKTLQKDKNLHGAQK